MRRFVAVAVLLLWLPLPAAAQWRIGLGAAWERAAGFSRGQTEGETVRFVPYRPRTWAGRVDWFRQRLGGSLEIRWAEPDLGLEGQSGAVVLANSGTSVLGVRPAVALRLARLTEHVTLAAEAGPILELWSFTDEDRQRISGEAGLYLDVGLGGRLSGLVGASGAVTPSSPFAGALPDGYRPRAGWRWGLRATVLYRP